MSSSSRETRRFGQVDCPSSGVSVRSACGGTCVVRADLGEDAGPAVTAGCGRRWRSVRGSAVLAGTSGRWYADVVSSVGGKRRCVSVCVGGVVG